MFAGRRTLALGGSVDFAKKWTAQALFYGQLNKGNAADTLHDRRLINLNVSYKF